MTGGFIMSELTPLQKAIKRVKGRFGEVSDRAKTLGDGNTPSQGDKDDVSGWLDEAESELATIHDPGQSPSLSPTSAGSEQTPTIPDSRCQTCEDAADLAAEAETEAGQASPDYDYIGDRTRTLEGSYLDAIRDKFEID
jgi:hypothetical protein